MSGLLIAILLGWAGGYQFYKGKVGMGFLYLFTFGLFGIGWIIDIVRAASNLPSQDLNSQDTIHANPQRALITEEFSVAGSYYYKDNIYKLACKNPDWTKKNMSIIKDGKEGKSIFRYNFINKPVKLEKEPTNSHSKNAIKVLIAGELVGYIAETDVLHVHQILDQREIKYISAFISGGEYKIITESSTLKLEKEISITVKIGYV